MVWAASQNYRASSQDGWMRISDVNNTTIFKCMYQHSALHAMLGASGSATID